MLRLLARVDANAASRSSDSSSLSLFRYGNCTLGFIRLELTSAGADNGGVGIFAIFTFCLLPGFGDGVTGIPVEEVVRLLVGFGLFGPVTLLLLTFFLFDVCKLPPRRLSTSRFDEALLPGGLRLRGFFLVFGFGEVLTRLLLPLDAAETPEDGSFALLPLGLLIPLPLTDFFFDPAGLFGDMGVSAAIVSSLIPPTERQYLVSLQWMGCRRVCNLAFVNLLRHSVRKEQETLRRMQRL